MKNRQEKCRTCEHNDAENASMKDCAAKIWKDPKRLDLVEYLIENHSSTLKEAMTVGVPCVASYVGGVPEYATSESNCLLYRFEDYEVMALQIMRLFESDDLCEKLSVNARNDMAESKRKNDFYLISKEIYKTIINEK